MLLPEALGESRELPGREPLGAGVGRVAELDERRGAASRSAREPVASSSEPPSALRRWANTACTNAPTIGSAAGPVRLRTSSAESTRGVGRKTLLETARGP